MKHTPKCVLLRGVSTLKACLLFVLFLGVTAANWRGPRSDELSEAISQPGRAGFQLPMKVLSPEQALARKRTGYSVPFSMNSHAETWGIPIRVGSTSSLTVIFDTGSSDLLVSGNLCTTDGCTTGTKYSPSSGASYVTCTDASSCGGNSYWEFCDNSDVTDGNSYCAAENCYGGGYGAYSLVITDTFGIPGIPITVNTGFGNIYSPVASNCGTINETYGGGLIVQGWSGILGVSFVQDSVIGTNPPPLDALLAANNLPIIFSMCVEQTNAFLSVGADYYCNSDFAFTPIVSLSDTANQFFINLADVGVGSTSLGLGASSINDGGTLVDSGTSLMLLNTELFNGLFNSLHSLCGSTNLVGICGQTIDTSIFVEDFALTSSQFGEYPSIYFKIGTATITLLNSDYLIDDGSAGIGKTYYFAGFEESYFNILGDIFLQKVHAVFDKGRGVIGFGQLSDCTLAASSYCNRTAPAHTSPASNLASSSFLSFVWDFLFQ